MIHNSSYIPQLLIILMLTIGCKSETSTHQTIDISRIQQDSTLTQQNNTIVFNNLPKLSFRNFITTYKKPHTEEEFFLNTPISEFRIELLNYFTQEEQSKSILIKEVTWNYSQNENITAWYQKKNTSWVFIHKLIWDKTSEF
ncbi:hypothetical protein [Aquimarina rhabdastrellae]